MTASSSAIEVVIDNGNAAPDAALPSPRGMFEKPTIRHAGRTQIRGKFRRVWRPRYLELLDSGLVRYYELPPMANVALSEDSDWEHVNMMPKDTLWIYHARIIDVTTLRDIHVGLPRGSHGFMFRGRPAGPGLHYSLSTVPAVASSTVPARDRLDSFVPEDVDRHHRRQDTPEMPTSSSIMTCHPPEVVHPRDFFCAVNTLEEAQTWVVVLEWAASMCRKHNLHSSDSMELPSSSDHDVHPHRLALSKPSVTPPRRGPITSLSLSPGPNPNPNPSSDVISILSSMTGMDATRKSRRSRQGKIVVTKVPKYRLIRIGYLKWEIAYEVNLLLLPQLKAKNKAQPSAVRSHLDDDRVEERCILMTPYDLERLMANLIAEFQGNDEAVSKQYESQLSLLRRATKLVSKLPRLHPSVSFDATKHMSVKSSLEIVNAMLRSLVTEATLVNSRAIKQCFVLDSASNPKQSKNDGVALSLSSILRPFVSPTYHNPQSVLYRADHKIPSDMAVDDYAKKWLSDGLNKTAKTTLTWWDNSVTWWSLKMLQKPLVPEFLLTTFSAGALFSIGLHRYAARPVTMRLDLLTLSWLAAASFGRYAPVGKQRSAPSIRKYTTTIKAPVEDLNDDVEADLSDTEVEGEEVGEDVDIQASGSFGGQIDDGVLSSPLPRHPANNGESCWSTPPDNIFRVRGPTYLDDKIKICSDPSPFECRGVDVWLTDNPERNISRLPCVLGGKLGEKDTFLVNFLLPFGNFVAYFAVPELKKFPPKLAKVWTNFLKGDQQYRDARFKFLPIVMDGPWIVKAAVGNGTSPALLSKVIPLQYFFREPSKNQRGVYEVDVIITASSIAKGILSVVRGHTKSLSIAFAFIIEASEREDLPETVLSSFQLHALHLEHCPQLPEHEL